MTGWNEWNGLRELDGMGLFGQEWKQGRVDEKMSHGYGQPSCTNNPLHRENR